MSSLVNTTFTLTNAELGVMVSLNIIFSTGGTVGNVLVCFAFLLYRNLRSAMNIFIFSLACSDLLVCLVAQPMFVVCLLRNCYKEDISTVPEDIRKRLSWISLLASIGNLLGVTLDRYFIISNPLRYAARVTTNSACAFVAVVWTIALVLGIITESYREAKLIGQLYVAVLLIGIIIPLYCRILCIARRHARVIHSSFCHVQVNHRNKRNSFASVQRACSSSNIQKADRNSLKTVGIISSIFVIGWFPLLILPFLYRNGVYDRDVMLDALQWANSLALCSSACNPVVYSWRDRRFRRALAVAYGKWKARRSIPDTGCSEKHEMKTIPRTLSLKLYLS